MGKILIPSSRAENTIYIETLDCIVLPCYNLAESYYDYKYETNYSFGVFLFFLAFGQLYDRKIGGKRYETNYSFGVF